jgi:ribosome-binding protein aMBF1 (putative translation factor)
MIKNERQYRITKSWVQKFTQTLARLDAHPEESAALHPLLQKAERDGLKSQIETLQQEVAEYEALANGRPRLFLQDSFAELPRTLIKARIAAGLSQKELAGRLGLKEQQIQRYEATEYASASLERVGAVIQALGLTVREEGAMAEQVPRGQAGT